MLNDTSTGTVAVPRLTVKGQKIGGAPILRNSCPFPQVVRNFLPLLSLWSYPACKNQPPRILGPPLVICDGPLSACGICISLNTPAFTLLWLTLEFFPAQSQGPSVGGQSQGFTQNLGQKHSYSSCRECKSVWSLPSPPLPFKISHHLLKFTDFMHAPPPLCPRHYSHPVSYDCPARTLKITSLLSSWTLVL